MHQVEQCLQVCSTTPFCVLHTDDDFVLNILSIFLNERQN